jgi:malate dehydrogenase (oxaloacetate-decarboxylating)(NADP+)
MPHDNVILCDSRGVIYRGREVGMNQWKSAHAVETDARSLADAIKGADVFIGLSVKGAVTKEMVKSMAAKPLIFAMANPDPEITPEDVAAVRDDAIVATGRSDYPNQINNVLGFPYIFRGALDVRASQINDAMKIAAAHALAALAREDVPDEVDAAYGGLRMRYGPNYLIPVPFDPRLITTVPLAVAQAAMDSGVAQRPIADMDAYRRELSARLDPRAPTLHSIYERLRANPRRTVFAEGEEDRTIRAAQAYRDAGYGTPVLIGRGEEVAERIKALGIDNADGLEIHNAKLSSNNQKYTDFLYARLRRRGFLYRDCQRMVNLDRNVFAACMVACGDADAMVTGATRSFAAAFEEICRVIDPKPGERVIGLQIVITEERTVFISDMRVHELPSAEELADIAVESAAYARGLGHEPRVALLSYSNFGQPSSATTERVRDAVAILDQRGVDFEYDGEMAADTALNPELRARLYPFCRLTGPANVLIMPALHSASIAAKLLQEIGGGTVVGPVLLGLEKPVQIVQMGATADDLVTAAALAAHDAIE